MQLFNGDCLEVMKNIPDKSVDMVLCDLPYGTTACKWDNVIPFEPMWEHLNRIIKDNGAICLFGIEPFSSYLRMSNIKNYKYDWIWEKSKKIGHLVAKLKPLSQKENIMVFSKGKTCYFPIMIKREKIRKDKVSTVKSGSCQHLNFKNKRKGEYIYDEYYPTDILRFNSESKPIHPTQKPIALLEYLIKTYTLENETVLDFTMGSGSTGVAAVKNHRDFIGIELDKKYFEIAKERINEAAMLNSIAYKSTVGRSD